MRNVQRLEGSGLENLIKFDDGLRYSLALCESKGISEKPRLLRLFRMSNKKFKTKRGFPQINNDF